MCLEKDVRRRLHDVADARLELEDTHPEPALSPDRGYHWRAWVVIVLCSAATGALGWLIGARAKPEPLDMSRVLLDVRPATSLLGSNPIERAATGRSRPSRTAVALSPNGRIVAFTAQRDGVTKLYIRALDQTEATAVAGTEGADSPMFSPNGNWIGFWSNNAIRKVSLAGGPPVKVCDARLPYGSSWSADGTIVFASQDTMIWKVDSGGGKRQRITNRGQAGDDVRDLLPQILPGGKWLLFTVQPTVFDWEHTRVVAQSLETGERKVVLEDAADARYVPTGHLVFMRQGNLMAAPFDVDRGRLTGSETGMVEGVMQSINANSVPLDTGAGQFAFSSTGTLVYVAGEVHPDVEGTLQWIDRNGRIEQIAAPRRLYFLPRLSPDGRHVVVTTFGIQDHSLWRYDFADHTLLRLTTEGHVAWPFWSPDGTQIAFCLAITGPLNLFVLGADGGVAPRRLGQSPVTQFSGSWTPDGRSIVYDEDPTNHDIKILPASGELKSQPLIATRFNEQMPELSPDGRWIAYVFDETGRGEVGVQAFPHLGQKRQISTAGGTNPAWSRDGRKLTFLTRPERPRDEFMQLMEMDVTPGANFTSTPARPLFEPVFGGDIARSYDMTADASRFIFVHHTYPPSTSAPRELQVVEHWFEELKARVPTK